MNIIHRGTRLIPVLLVAAAGVLLASACSSASDRFEAPPPTIINDIDAGDAAPPPVTCGAHCSRDLKQVLTGCEGAETVLAQCDANQGCGGTTCVDACTAASANKGSAGCDFWAAEPTDPGSDERGACFAALIANTWDRPAALSAEFGKDALDISHSTYTVDGSSEKPVYKLLQGPLPAGQVAVVFLAHDAALTGAGTAPCPSTVTPAMVEDKLLQGTSISTAFHIKTDTPISAYSIYPYGGADTAHPTATLLLPSTSWEKNYIAISPFNFVDPDDQGQVQSERIPRTLQLVANEDDTTITMLPTLQVVATAGVAGSPPGVAQSWTLSKGQVLQFAQDSLTGSVIESSKPIAMFGGSECTDLLAQFCDQLQQQISPVSQWGTEYAVVPYKPRIASLTSTDDREKVPYTITGAAAGTTLTYEPSRPLNAPETLGVGESVSFLTDQLFVVKSQDSQHPFHVNVYMTSAEYGGGNKGQTVLGDPDFVNVPPAGQYLDHYVFFTDFTYQETSLTVVRKKTAKGFEPVTLDCAGDITGFQPLGSSGEYEFAWVELTRGFVGQKLAAGTCGYGRQEAHSNAPFAVTVWGTDLYASYGYVGGTGLRPINDAAPPKVR